MNSRPMFVVSIRNGKRHAVYAAHAHDESHAAQLVLGKNEGWELSRVVPKDSPGVFKLYDSADETVVPEDVHTDAERYRFLRDGMHEDINVCDWSHVQWPSEQPYTVRGAAVDALVDKARSTPQNDTSKE